jgi:hypothetical protein
MSSVYQHTVFHMHEAFGVPEQKQEVSHICTLGIQRGTAFRILTCAEEKTHPCQPWRQNDRKI